MLNINFRYLIFNINIAHIKYIKGVISNIRRFGFTGHIVKLFQIFGDLGFTVTNILGAIVNIRRFGFTGHFISFSHLQIFEAVPLSLLNICIF